MTTRRWCCLFGVTAVVLAGGPAASAAAPAAAKERRLHLAAAEASSYLVNDWNRFQENYLPLYLGDDDAKTAWNLKTEGIGEWVRVHVTPMEGATRVRLKVRNGYQKTDKLFAANSRAHGLTVVLLPSKTTVDLDLADKPGWQELTVAQPAGPLEAVELRVRSVYAGKKYDDLCISDLQLYVTAASSDNPAFEKLRFEKIATWKKERLEAARLFQTELGKSLPIAAQYLVQQVEESAGGRGQLPDCGGMDDQTCLMKAALGRATAKAAKGKHAAAVEQAVALAGARFGGMTAVRIAPRDKRRTPRVDGLCNPSLDVCLQDPCYQALPLPLTGQVAYLNADALAVVEQSGLPSYEDVMKEKLPQCRRAEPVTFAWVLRDPAPAGRIRALLLASCGMVDTREGQLVATRPQLLVYGADGALEVVAGQAYASVLEWSRDADGPKLASASVTSAFVGSDLTVQQATAVAGK